jgi:hypothetical protein
MTEENNDTLVQTQAERIVEEAQSGGQDGALLIHHTARRIKPGRLDTKHMAEYSLCLMILSSRIMWRFV